MPGLADMVVKVSADVGDVQAKMAATGASIEQLGTRTVAASTKAAAAFSSLNTSGGQSLFQLKEKLIALESALFTEKDITKIRAYNIQIQQTKAELKALGTEGFETASRGATQFNNAISRATSLGSLGAKEINRLTRTALSLGTAFAFTAVAEGVSLLIEYFNKVGAKSEEAQKKITDFKKEVAGIFDSSGKEATQAVSLIAVLKSETETRERKLAAIKELNKISPEIFNNLKLEGNAVAGLDADYTKYLQSLRTVIAAKVFQAQLESKITELLTLQGVTQDANTKRLVASLKHLSDERNKSLESKGGANFVQELQSVQKGVDAIKLEKINLLNQDIADIQKSLIELSSGIKVDIDKDRLHKAKKTVEDVLAEMRAKVEEANILENLFHTDKSKERVSAIMSAISTLVTTFKLDPHGDLIKGLFSDAAINQAGFIAKSKLLAQGVRIKQELQNALTVKPLEIPIAPVLPGEQQSNILVPIEITAQITGLNVADEDSAKEQMFLKGLGIVKGMQDGVMVAVSALRFPELKKLADEAKKAIESLRGSITNDFENVFANIGDSIGRGIAEGNIGGALGNLFSGIFKILGNGLRQTGLYIIGMSKLMIKLKASIAEFSPAGQLIAGIGLVALGTLISSAASHIPGFADGVTNFGGGIALVGERGPELMRLPNGADIIPNNAINSLSQGSGVQVYIPSFTLRGQDILVAFNRATDSNNRRT